MKIQQIPIVEKMSNKIKLDGQNKAKSIQIVLMHSINKFSQNNENPTNTNSRKDD